MSDPTTPAAPTAATETSAPSAPVPAAQAPATQSATPPETPKAEAPAEKPAPRVNPWALRPAKAAQPVEKPAAPAAQATPAQPAPTAPSPDEIVAGRVRETLVPFATAALADLPESARAAITEIAGDDPAAQLKAAAALRKSGLVAGTIPAGAHTAQPSPPTPAPTASNPDAAILATYRALKATAPIRAEHFRAANSAAIARAEAASN